MRLLPRQRYAAATALIDRDAEFSAVIGGNDQIAIGALVGLRDSGWSAPDDVSVAGIATPRSPRT